MKMERIQTIKDERIVFARSLQQRKGRQETGCFLVEGWGQVRWAIEGSVELKYLLVHDKLDPDQIDEQLIKSDVPMYSCTEGILKKASGTSYLVPAVGVVSKKELGSPTGDFSLVLDGVKDFGNIGTIVRTAAAFGIEDIIGTSPDFDLYQRKCIDASRGTVMHANFEGFNNPLQAVENLKKRGYQIVATTLEGSTLQSLAKLEKRPVAIVFGNETHGVSQEVLQQADLRIQIPMATELDSLNVGVAAGISLYELKLKMVMMMLNEKIRGSLGRNLFAAARWLRRLFNEKLQEVSPLTADQAVILMILACDETGEKNPLLTMAGIDTSKEREVYEGLLSEGYLDSQGSQNIAITHRGKEMLGRIWTVHENVENKALRGLSSTEKNQLQRLLSHIQGNLEDEISYE